MSGPSTPAPSPLQPGGQNFADSQYSNLTQNLAQAGTSLYQNTVPALDAQTYNILHNPYAGQAQTYAQWTSDQAMQNVAPMDFSMANTDYGLGQYAAQAAPGVLQDATAKANQAWAQAQAAIPQATGGYQLAPQVYNQIMSKIPAATQGFNIAPYALSSALSMLPQATAQLPYAMQTLQAGYDPQNALYSRTMQQLMDQQNAINASSGLAGSPYGAGLTGQAAENFNIDWQNQQLNRQIAALGAYDQASQTATSDFTNLWNSGVGNYNSLIDSAAQNLTGLTGAAVGDYNSLVNSATGNLTSLLNSGAQDYSTLMNTGISGYDSLSSSAQSAFNNASGLNTSGLGAMTLGAQLPYDMSQSISENNMRAIAQQIAGTSAAMQPWQQAISDQGSYLSLGQDATKGALAAWAAQLAANNQNMAGLSSLFGAGADMIGLGGGLGSLFGLGAGSSSVTDMLNAGIL